MGDDREHLKHVLSIKQARLQYLEIQIATLGEAHCDASMLFERDKLIKEIKELKGQIGEQISSKIDFACTTLDAKITHFTSVDISPFLWGSKGASQGDFYWQRRISNRMRELLSREEYGESRATFYHILTYIPDHNQVSHMFAKRLGIEFVEIQLMLLLQNLSTSELAVEAQFETESKSHYIFTNLPEDVLVKYKVVLSLPADHILTIIPGSINRLQAKIRVFIEDQGLRYTLLHERGLRKLTLCKSFAEILSGGSIPGIAIPFKDIITRMNYEPVFNIDISRYENDLKIESIDVYDIWHKYSDIYELTEKYLLEKSN